MYRQIIRLFCLFFLSMMPAAHAQSVRALGGTDAWQAFTFIENNNQKVCYILGTPIDARGEYERQGKVHLVVTHRPNQNSFDVVSIAPGYVYQPGTEATIEVGGQRFAFLTKGDRAFALENATDQMVVKKMLSAPQLFAIGFSKSAKTTLDKYDLKDFGKAYDLINQECQVKRP